MTDEALEPAGPAIAVPSRRSRAWERTRRAVPFGSGVLAALVGVLAYTAMNPGQPPLTQQDVNLTVAQALASETPGPALSQVAYAAVQPSLVLIRTQSPGTSDASQGSLGSGVVVDTNGDILTSLHVVADAALDPAHLRRRHAIRPPGRHARSPTRTSRSCRRRTLPATSVPATLGNPRAIQIGSDAYAVGNPFGLYGSISSGVVSGPRPILPRSPTAPGPRRPHPGRRGREPRQLGRPAPQPRRPGHRHRHRPRQPDQGRRVRRHRARRADRRGRRRRRPAASTDRRAARPQRPRSAGGGCRWTRRHGRRRTVPMERVLYEVKKVIVGQDTCWSGWSSPCSRAGTCWSKACRAWPRPWPSRRWPASIGGEFKRIQFTPDLVPADLVGTRIYNQKTGEFNDLAGPVFTNLLLADEINRAPAKVQSALLEVMQERQVTIGRETLQGPGPVPGPGDAEPDRDRGHLRAAGGAGRPVHAQGAGRLSQPDRGVRDRRAHDRARRGPQQVLSTRRPARAPARRRTRSTSIRRCSSTRSGSRPPRARPARAACPNSSATSRSAPARARRSTSSSPRRALAFVRGRDYALPQDVRDMARDVMRHRLVLSFEALSDNVSATTSSTTVLRPVPSAGRAAEGAVATVRVSA